MTSYGLQVRNIDGMRETSLKVFYECMDSDWEYIKIKIIPDHPNNLHSKVAIAKYLKTCGKNAFVKITYSHYILWSLALIFAYISILIA